MKRCIRCEIEKELSAFHKMANQPDGRKRTCKSCRSEQERSRYERNRDHIIARAHKHYHEVVGPRMRGKPQTEKQKAREKAFGPRRNQLRRDRRKRDKEYQIVTALRARVSAMLSGESKSASTMELLGCSVEALRTHLESLFQPGMSWENYGFRGWHIDHIKPCSAFNLTGPAQQRACFHWSNLQPLWAFDNISKGAKYEDETYRRSTRKETGEKCHGDEGEV